MSGPVQNTTSRSGWRTFLAIVGETAAKVFWEPIRSGSPRWATWPKGLRTIAVLTGLAYVVCTVLVVASVRIRATDPLVYNNGDTYPAWATTVLLWATVLVVTLALTAALHVHPLLRVVVLVYVGVALLVTTVGTRTGIPWAVGAIVGLVAWYLIRARRGFAWFEFPVVLGLVALGVYGPLAAVPFGAGADLRPATLALLMTVVSSLSMPMLVMAGYAPAEIAVTLSEWLLNRISVETTGSRVRPVVLGVGIVAGLGVLAVDVLGGLRRQEWDFRTEAWVSSALVVGISVVWSWLMLRRRPGEPPSQPTATTWEPYAWILVILWVAVLIPLLFLVIAGSVLALVGQEALFVVIQSVTGSDLLFGIWRILLCVLALILLIRNRRRGGRVVPVLLVCFITMAGLGASRMLTGERLAISWTLQTVVALAVVPSLLAVVVAVVRRRGVERQLWIALLALLLSALVGRRELLAEPGSLAAGISGLVVLLFGLVWRVLTDAGITRGNSRWLPQSSRVLLFAANALLGTVVLAHLALTRQENPAVDVEEMAAVGVNVIGSPLVLGAILLGLLSTLGLAAPPRRGTLPGAPTGELDEKTGIRDHHT